MSVFVPTSSGGGAYDYLEYGWVCAPNVGGQSISANTVTTLTLDTEVVDAGSHGSISSNQVTLATGTYYFEAETAFSNIGVAAIYEQIFSLYNTSDSAYVKRSKMLNNGSQASFGLITLNGQFIIASSKTFELRVAVSDALYVGAKASSAGFTLNTAGADQRTTLKLWKLA